MALSQSLSDSSEDDSIMTINDFSPEEIQYLKNYINTANGNFDILTILSKLYFGRLGLPNEIRELRYSDGKGFYTSIMGGVCYIFEKPEQKRLLSMMNQIDSIIIEAMTKKGYVLFEDILGEQKKRGIVLFRNYIKEQDDGELSGENYSGLHKNELDYIGEMISTKDEFNNDVFAFDMLDILSHLEIQERKLGYIEKHGFCSYNEYNNRIWLSKNETQKLSKKSYLLQKEIINSMKNKGYSLKTHLPLSPGTTLVFIQASLLTLENDLAKSASYHGVTSLPLVSRISNFIKRII